MSLSLDGLHTADGEEYVHGPARLRQRVAAGVVQYAHGDWLGGVRMTIDSASGTDGGSECRPLRDCRVAGVWGVR